MWLTMAIAVLIAGIILSFLAASQCQLRKRYLHYRCKIEYTERLKMSVWLSFGALLAQGEFESIQNQECLSVEDVPFA